MPTLTRNVAKQVILIKIIVGIVVDLSGGN